MQLACRKRANTGLMRRPNFDRKTEPEREQERRGSVASLLGRTFLFEPNQRRRS